MGRIAPHQEFQQCLESGVFGKCVLVWFKCTKKTSHNDYKSVGAKVSFGLAGTSYISSSTTCGIGTKPQCCFKFPSPVGKRCLKLY